MNGTATHDNVHGVAVVGGATADVGVAMALKHAGVESFVAPERQSRAPHRARLLRFRAPADVRHSASLTGSFHGWDA